MSIDITIHSTGMGQCALSGKESEGLRVTFKDGTLKEGFLSHKAFVQLVKMKCGQSADVAPRPAAAPPVNGPAVVK